MRSVAVRDGQDKNLVIRCGYGTATENDPTPARVSINLSERVPAGGGIEKRIILATKDGKIFGAVIQRIFAEHVREPISREEQHFTPDEAHLRVLRKLYQNPHIYNHPSDK